MLEAGIALLVALAFVMGYQAGQRAARREE